MRFAAISPLVTLLGVVSTALAANIPNTRDSAIAERSNGQVWPSYDRIHNDIKKLWKKGQRLDELAPTGNDTKTPGYKYLWGPATAAVKNSNYISYKILDSYDVDACAAECGRHNHAVGVCEGINLWRASFSGDAVAVVCMTFGNPPSKDSARFSHRGGLTVSWSRGYERTNVLPYAGFDGEPDSGPFWTIEGDASIDRGTSFSSDFATSSDQNLNGTITSVPIKDAVPGRRYAVLLSYVASVGEEPISSLFALKWNGEFFGTPLYDDPVTKYRYFNFRTPPAKGNDIFQLYGGSVGGSWSVDFVQLFII